MRFKEVRQLRGMTQACVAEHLGMSRAAYTNIENCKREADYKTLKALSDFYDVSTDYLLGKSDVMHSNALDDEDIKFALFGGGGDITDEMFEDVKRFAEYIRMREDEKKEDAVE